MSSIQVTAIVPVYNGQETVHKAIESILDQDYPVLDLIVIDDKSTDNSLRVLQELLRKDSRLTLIKHEKNLGLAASLNEGLAIARGQCIFMLHQDCYLESKDWFSKALKHFCDPTVVAVTGRPKPPGQFMSFSQKVFAALRGRFEEFSNSDTDEISFFEDKCDLYRKETLMNVGGFSAEVLRISGEDQMLSYKFRKMGFRLLRDNTLLFVQGFSKSESSLLGNLEKEYVYGKTQAGVVFHHGLFVFSKTRSSPGLLRRTLHRVTKPVFTASVLISLMYSVLGSTISGVLILSSLIMARLVFFSWLCAKSSLKLTFTERFMASIIGLATDFVYSVGIACGVLLSLLHKRL